MAHETREWSVPAPVRALLWWPAISFVLVVVAPDAATGAIVIAGAALALLGGLVSTAARRWRKQPVPAADGPALEETTMEIPADMPTTVIPKIGSPGRRAA